MTKHALTRTLDLLRAAFAPTTTGFVHWRITFKYTQHS